MRTYQTKSREKILNYLKKNADYSLSAAEVHSYLKQNDETMNLTTVYRNLDKLAELGMLMRVKSADGDCCKYQYISEQRNCSEHLHMQCRECGKLFHLECEFMDDITEHLMRHHGFSLESSGSMLSGLCQECRGSQK